MPAVVLCVAPVNAVRRSYISIVSWNIGNHETVGSPGWVGQSSSSSRGWCQGFPCVTTTPLGRDVEPGVSCSNAGSRGSGSVGCARHIRADEARLVFRVSKLRTENFR
jgi:hypothetical protein